MNYVKFEARKRGQSFFYAFNENECIKVTPKVTHEPKVESFNFVFPDLTNEDDPNLIDCTKEEFESALKKAQKQINNKLKQMQHAGENN